MFFTLSSWELALVLAAIVLGATGIGILVGRELREHSEALREPLGVVQGALLGLVGLILAFGLSMAVGRYESRRTAVVDDANSIGTTYLRAQTLAEPVRTRSLALLRQYTDASLRLSHAVPNSPNAHAAIGQENVLQRQLWSLAGQALVVSPDGNASRLYVDSLNSMIDMQTVRVSALNNRVPFAVLGIEVLGAALALGLLALYLAMLRRGYISVILAAALITLLLLVTFDLDRPTRGLVRVPTGPLLSVRASMALPPAAQGPSGR